jgi:hypothetical protein
MVPETSAKIDRTEKLPEKFPPPDHQQDATVE